MEVSLHAFYDQEFRKAGGCMECSSGLIQIGNTLCLSL